MNISQIISSGTLKKIIIGCILEFGPTVLFLSSFDHFHIYKATFILMIATIISTVLTYWLQKRLPYVALYIAMLTLVFGYMTLTLHKPQFIQMRDTLYDVTSALTLLIGLMVNVQFLKIAFHKVIPMSTRAWYRITWGWIAFLIITAISNEYVRRTMSLHDWFDFKNIVLVSTVLFGCLIVYFLYEKENK